MNFTSLCFFSDLSLALFLLHPHLMICPHCHSNEVTKKGFFRKKLVRRYIQRFFCLSCKSKFSASTLSATYWQKKPHLNKAIYLNLCSGMSLRRTAKNMDICFMTVYNRFLWLSGLATVAHKEFLENLYSTKELYLDEMGVDRTHKA